MSTVTMHPFGSGPVRDRTLAPTTSADARAELPPFWSSLFGRPSAAPARAEPTRPAQPSSALVGGLWIQIR